MRARPTVLLLLTLACAHRSPPQRPAASLPAPWERLHTACTQDTDCDAGQRCLDWGDAFQAPRPRTCEVECRDALPRDAPPGQPVCPTPLRCAMFSEVPTVCWHPDEEPGARWFEAQQDTR